MSELLREQAEFRKGKTPLIQKYIVDHKQLFNEIAGRGFLNLPGYAYDAVNGIELAAKMGLSELNYKILSETIERELKQQGVNYDNSYKTALMAWELEKQDLMVAWDAELALIKQGMSEQDDTKARLSIALEARQVILMTAKTAIDLQMEAYKKELAELDRTIAPYEVQLANAKLLTAQKKLELIPIIQTIITKEGELIAIESQKAVANTALMAEEQQVAVKKQQEIPGLAAMANVTTEYANLIPSEIAIKKQIAAEKVSQEEAKVNIADNDNQRVVFDIATEKLDIQKQEASRTLANTQFDNEQSLLEDEIDKDTTYENDNNASFGKMIADDKATQAKIISDGADINKTKNDTALKSTMTLTEARIAAAGSETNANIDQIQQVATINAAAKITAQLTHLIG